MLTRKQFEKMTPYRQHLWTAVNCSYARAVGMDGFEALNEVYKELFRKDSGLITGCSRCRLNSLKELGKLYFEYEKRLAEETKKQEDDGQAQKELEEKPKSTENQRVPKNKANNKTKTKKK